MITKIWRNLCAHGRSLKVNDDHDLWVLAAIKTGFFHGNHCMGEDTKPLTNVG